VTSTAAVRQVEGMEARGNAQVVRYVPLGTMFGYTTELRSSTQGRATSSMEFAFYQPLPDHLAQEIITKRRG
jgi:elongation factor G